MTMDILKKFVDADRFAQHLGIEMLEGRQGQGQGPDGAERAIT